MPLSFRPPFFPLSTTYLICEGLGWEAGIDKKFVEAPQFYGIYSLLIFLGAGIILYPNFPLIPIMYFSQVLNGMVLPFVLIFMLLLINDKKDDGRPYQRSNLQRHLLGDLLRHDRPHPSSDCPKPLIHSRRTSGRWLDFSTHLC